MSFTTLGRDSNLFEANFYFAFNGQVSHMDNSVKTKKVKKSKKKSDAGSDVHWRLVHFLGTSFIFQLGEGRSLIMHATVNIWHLYIVGGNIVANWEYSFIQSKGLSALTCIYDHVYEAPDSAFFA